MKKTSNRRIKLQLTISWSTSDYLDWLVKLEKLLHKKPRMIQIDIVGTGEIPADTALLIRTALLERSPNTQIVMNARSSLQGASVLIWLMGDRHIIRDDARIFFRRAILPDDAEVDPNADWSQYEPMYRDSMCKVDPEEGDYARVLKLINEFLPVKELAGRLISVPVLKQFGLIDNESIDTFLKTALAKSRQELVYG